MVHGLPSKFLRGRVQSRQGGGHVATRGNIIKANEGHVFWNADSRLVQPPEGTECHRVVGREEGGGTGIE